jgi:hypothetical protein
MLGHDAYNKLSYYERWTASMSRLLIDKGHITQVEIDAKIADLRIRLAKDIASEDVKTREDIKE